MPTEVATPKIVQEYQATDPENGAPIGKPTHLEADTWEEMAGKMKQAHISASQALFRQNQALDRLKARKPIPAPVVVEAPKMTVEQERTEAAKLTNPATAADAVRKLSGTNELQDELRKAKIEQARARGQAIGYQFMQRHLKDYYPCQANAEAIGRYLTENKLDGLELDNWEIAFAAIEDQLAKDPAQSNVAHTSNATPGNEQQQETVAQASEQPRRQPSFGIQPGAGSGARPTGQPAGLTKKDVVRMAKDKSPAGRAEWRRRMSDPKLKAELDAAAQRG